MTYGYFLALATAGLVAVGCTKAEEAAQPATGAPVPIAVAEAKGEVKWVDPAALQASPELHESLPPELIARIERVHAVFADVDGTPIEKWIEDFRKDLHPDANVRVWEDMAVAYEGFLSGRELPLDTRREVFKVVLLRSMAPGKEVLERLELEHLSREQAQQVIDLYPADPVPLTVLEK